MNSFRIFRQILSQPGSHWDDLPVLADALEDEGRLDLASVYRWAVTHKRWPFQRSVRNNTTTGNQTYMVYDWDLEGRNQGLVPEPAQLLPILYRHMSIPDRSKRYGGVHRAFVLLLRSLKAIGEL